MRQGIGTTFDGTAPHEDTNIEVAQPSAAASLHFQDTAFVYHDTQSDDDEDWRPLKRTRGPNGSLPSHSAENDHQSSETKSRSYLDYPTVSAETKYAMIVRLEDQVVELACCICGGNHYKTKASRVWHPLKGIRGVQTHITRSHADEVYTADQGNRDLKWMARNCVRKILDKRDLEAVQAGQYQVEATLARSADPSRTFA